MLVHLVADYGTGDLAFSEVAQRLLAELPRAQVLPLSVDPFDTLGAGFCVAQLALRPGPRERVVVHNVAPRQDESEPRDENEGEPFAAAIMAGGEIVCGALAGFTFSFVAPEAERVHLLAMPAAGSQFRSRDLLPEAVARLVRGDERALGEPLDVGAVPPVPERAVAYVDGYGNLKTTLEEPPAPPGTELHVRIGERTETVVVGGGTFEVPDGALALAPGSSGWTRRDGSERVFLELLLRGGSAAERFGGVRAGAPIEIGVGGGA